MTIEDAKVNEILWILTKIAIGHMNTKKDGDSDVKAD